MKRVLSLITLLAFSWHLTLPSVSAQSHNGHVSSPTLPAMPPGLIQKIKQSIRERYGTNPANPTQEHFFDEPPPSGFFEALRNKQLNVDKKPSEPTEDVCFVYEVKEGGETWKIKLSTIGKFAVLMRITEGKPLLIIATKPTQGPTRKMFDVITAYEYEVLDKRTLSIPLTLRISFLPGLTIKVYQALFTRRKKLPWE